MTLCGKYVSLLIPDQGGFDNLRKRNHVFGIRQSEVSQRNRPRNIQKNKMLQKRQFRVLLNEIIGLSDLLSTLGALVFSKSGILRLKNIVCGFLLCVGVCSTLLMATHCQGCSCPKKTGVTLCYN